MEKGQEVCGLDPVALLRGLLKNLLPTCSSKLVQHLPLLGVH